MPEKARCKSIPADTPLKEKIEILLAECIEDPETGCLISPRGRAAGYPMIQHDRKKISICRLILIERGIEMEGLVTRHLCHNKQCLNSDHLTHGTSKENSIDSAKVFNKGRHKLKGEDVIHEIRSKKNIEPQHVTAKRHGLSQAQISRIWLGKSYAWLPWRSARPDHPAAAPA